MSLSLLNCERYQKIKYFIYTTQITVSDINNQGYTLLNTKPLYKNYFSFLHHKNAALIKVTHAPTKPDIKWILSGKLAYYCIELTHTKEQILIAMGYQDTSVGISGYINMEPLVYY